jgi:hypothetical protein
VIKAQLWKWCGFGITSGTITTLGLIAGLHSGTQSKLAILVGIMVLAVADALSDAIGIHISEEAENMHTTREQWQSAFFTFISKLGVALSFIIPLQTFDIFTAIFYKCNLGGAVDFSFQLPDGKIPETEPRQSHS